MTEIESGLQHLKSQYPEWTPWLTTVQAILDETVDAKWDAMVPLRAQTGNKAPLLSEATISSDEILVRSLLAKLARVASSSGTSKMATLARAAHADLNVLELFKASLHQDRNALGTLARGLGVDSEVFQAVCVLLPVPFLQACNRRWGNLIPAGWAEGYCPVCGSWPALAEVRGIERSRYLRCGRCGAGWQAHCLFCPYCGMTDHKELASLLPEKSGANAAIDACNRCLGYIKTFTRLQGSPPAKLFLDDLASVELDVAAADHGYKRPQGTGYRLNVTLTN